MKGAYLILPFLAVLIAAIGAMLKSQLPEMPAAAYGAFGLALLLFAGWVALESKAIKAMLSRKGTKYGASSGIAVIVGLAIIITLAYLTNRPRFNLSHDMTSNKQNTLAEQSVKIVDQIRDRKLTVEVSAFFNDEEMRQRFKDLFHLYMKEGADFRVEYWNTDQQPAKVKAAELTSPNTVIFKSGTRESRLTTFTEEKITSSLLSILKENSKKLYFTTGHGEHPLEGQEGEGLSFIVGELKKNHYEVEVLALLEKTKVPEDADALLIVGPKYDFKPEEAGFVDDYLKSGGALLAMADALTPLPQLNGVLEKYGLAFADDFVLFSPDDPRAQFFGQNNALVSWFDEFNPLTRDFSKSGSVALMLPNGRTLTEKAENERGMKVATVAKSSDTVVKIANVASAGDLNENMDPARFERGEFPMIAVSTGTAKAHTVAANSQGKPDEEKADVPTGENTEAGIRVVAVGSSHLGTNAGLSRGIENLDMFMNIANYLVQDENLIAIRPKEKKSSKLELTGVTAGLSLMAITWLYPLVFLAIGIFIWMRRRAA